MDIPVALPYLIAFRQGVTVARRDGALVLQWKGRQRSLQGASRGLLAACEALSSGGAIEQALVELSAEEGEIGRAKVLYYLARFRLLGLLTYSATSEGRALATLIPVWNARGAAPGEVSSGARHALSRFAYLRREEAHLVLESPLGHARTQIFDARVATLFHLLAQPRTLEEVCREIPSLPPITAAMLLGLMLGSEAAGVEGAVDETRERSLQTWSFHDLLFHAGTRAGRHDERAGATYPYKDRPDVPPLPASKPRRASSATISLRRPDIAALVAEDVPFSRVIEKRRSIPIHGKRPIHVDRIAEFLYRSARIRAPRPRDEGVPYDSTFRPYPGAGACYELEVYLVVGACEGLDPGLYHYDPLDHALAVVAGPSRAVTALLDDARHASGNRDGAVHTLVVLSARFQRLTWKYESIAYALLLKDVGVLYQTMYLVATAMGLAPCALGNGNSDLFAEAAGLESHAETSVGEFLLGNRPDD
jgi:oxazoline/thiazoline dehydrogenase